MTFEVLEPVINDKNEPCWLVNTGTEKYSGNANKTIKETLKENKELKEKKVFELHPMGLWMCRTCGCIIKTDGKEPEECYENQGGCARKTTFEIKTKKINTDLWKNPKWKDIPSDEIDMQGLYNDLVNLLKKCLIFVEEISYKLLALWIISTWKTGHWETVCFPTFLGLINSGKSRCLDFIRETGYRMIHSSGVTFPAMVRASHYFQAGLLIDEVQNKLNPKDERGREYIDFIKPSYRIGSKYVVADKEDQEQLLSYNNFGFKAFAGERGFDRGLMDRTIVFDMEQDHPEITNFKEIQNEFDDIQTRLLNYRYKFNDPPDLENGTLRGRTKEIFECIICTGKHIGESTDDIIEYALNIEKEKEDELANTVEWEILRAIKNVECNETLDDAPEEIKYTDILQTIGWDTERKTSQRLGYILTKKFRLKTKRKTNGTVLLLTEPKNERRLKYLFKRYKA